MGEVGAPTLHRRDGLPPRSTAARVAAPRGGWSGWGRLGAESPCPSRGLALLGAARHCGRHTPAPLRVIPLSLAFGGRGATPSARPERVEGRFRGARWMHLFKRRRVGMMDPSAVVGQTFLAFDFGLKRTGVATGNRLTCTATPQGTIAAEGEARFVQIGQRLKEWQPDALVVGVPYHPDGAAHENTARALKFARQLRGRHGLPVYEVDERYSTTEAHSLGAKDADAASACIILEQFLRSLP